MKQNIFKDLPVNQKEEIFEVLAKGKNIKIEKIVSNGPESSSGEWYDQNNSEWVILLHGKAKIIFENKDEILNPGDHLLIPPHSKHKVEIIAENEITLWLAVHYD